MRVSLVIVLLLAAGTAFTVWMGAAPAEAHNEAFAPPRWQIHRAELAVGADETGPERSAVNTLLLDNANGQTWILWPSGKEDKPYKWIAIPR
jgi:hypothetical protein